MRWNNYGRDNCRQWKSGNKVNRKKRIAILASGSGSNFQAVADGCSSNKIAGEIVLLIYNRKNAYVRQRAKSESIEAHYINRIKSKSVKQMQKDVYDMLLRYDIDIIVLAGYLEKLNASIVDRWENKIVNTHPSLIPMFCGKGFHGHKVHQNIIDKGIKISGCTVHFVDNDYDTGPIIMQHAVEVLEDDTPETLAARILPFEHKCLVKSVGLLCRDSILIENGVVKIKRH